MRNECFQSILRELLLPRQRWVWHTFTLAVSLMAVCFSRLCPLNAFRLISCPRSDLHPNNILFQIPNFNSWTVDEVYKKFGEPVQVLNRRLDNGTLGPEVPSYSIFPADMIVPADQVKDNKIKISDFGEAFLTNPPKSLHTPMLLLPPETLFLEKFGPQPTFGHLPVHFSKSSANVLSSKLSSQTKMTLLQRWSAPWVSCRADGGTGGRSDRTTSWRMVLGIQNSKASCLPSQGP